MDETNNDINDTAQLAVFVRYETGSIMQERLLTVLRMSGRTTGSIIFHTFKTFMEATDEAPAMIVRNTGFENSCIIHESVLCAKLKCVYAKLMLRVMKKSQVSA